MERGAEEGIHHHVVAKQASRARSPSRVDVPVRGRFRRQPREGRVGGGGGVKKKKNFGVLRVGPDNSRYFTK